MTVTSKHVFAALGGTLRSTAGLIAVVLLGALPALQPASPVHIKATLTAGGSWLTEFNLWRAATALPTLSENTSWSAGDVNHAIYMVKTGLVTHSEDPANPYYTASGDYASRNSNIEVMSSTSFTDQQAIDWWMQAPFHAMGMMDPRLQTTGFGAYRDTTTSPWQAGFAVNTISGLNFSAGTYPVVFPGNGSIEPLRTYTGGEFPDPLQACPGYSVPTGLPVFVEVGANVHTSAGAHSFTGNGTPLAHCVIDSNSPSVGSNLTGRGGVIIVPQQPLQVGVTYAVAVTVNGIPYAWSFTVGQTIGGGVAAALAGRPIAGDFDGDGKADLALVTGIGTQVALSTGAAFGKPSAWTTIPFYGSKATLAGDVTGDGKADIVAVNPGQTFVMPSTGTALGPAQVWATMPFYGTRGTFLADVNGDGKADLIAVNDTNAWVMVSTGTGFGQPTPWSGLAFYGNVTTTVGDVNGDGKADLIAINLGSTWVMTSTGTSFSAPVPWSGQPFYGTVTTTVADVNGDGKADLIAVNGGNTWVMTSTGTGFNAPAPWSGMAFYGQSATFPADVTGDHKADLVAVNWTSLWVTASTGTALSAPALWL